MTILRGTLSALAAVFVGLLVPDCFLRYAALTIPKQPVWQRLSEAFWKAFSLLCSGFSPFYFLLCSSR
jgi:hypothetical protein